MKRVLGLMALASLLAAPAAYGQVDIATVRTVDDNCYPIYYGYSVTVEGLVKSGDELGSAGPAYLEDDTAGIAFYFYPVGVQTGDYVQITAWVDFFAGLIELADNPDGGDPPEVTILSSGNPVEPHVLTIPEMGETHEGKLIRFECVHFLETGVFESRVYEITDAEGNIGALYVDYSTDLMDQPIPETWVSITGCAGQYDTEGPDYCQGYQIIPRTIADLEYAPTATEDVSWSGVKALYR